MKILIKENTKKKNANVKAGAGSNPPSLFLLREYRLDKETLLITRFIIDKLRSLKPNEIQFFVNLSRLGIKREKGVKPFVVTVHRSRDKNLRIDGMHSNKNGYLTINLHIPYDFSFEKYRKDLEIFFADIKDTVRHELEHATKHLNLHKADIHHDDVNYYFSQHEIEAYAVGLMKSAKRRKQPIDTVIDEILFGVVSDLINNSGYSRESAEATANELRKEWISYIIKRFPKAQFSED